MKVCILSIVNVKHMSGAGQYFEYFKEKNIEYDLIYIDKYSIEETVGAKNVYKFEIKIEKKWNKYRKIMEYAKFLKFGQKILYSNNYDVIVVWGTETAFLFGAYLLSKGKRKYIINIRDYANLNSKVKRYTLDKLVKNSVFTTISSKGFKEFLPENFYTVMHSFNNSILNQANKRSSLRPKTLPLRICFIGNVRFYKNDLKLINSLGGDERFLIQYFGVGSEILKEYCEKNNIKNVEFKGAFNVEDTAELINQADVINNLYGYGDVSLDTAVSIKYFYSVYLKIPILVFRGTYMEKVSDGFSFDFDGDYHNLGDRIYNWYHSIDFTRMVEISDEKQIKMEKENEHFKNQLQKIFKVNK